MTKNTPRTPDDGLEAAQDANRRGPQPNNPPYDNALSREAAQMTPSPDTKPKPEPKPRASGNTLTLTDDELAPIRRRAELHKGAAKDYRSKVAKQELNDPEIGQPLAPAQVADFDMSGEFTKAAKKKARDAGYSGISNLRKEDGVWTFEGTNAPSA
jgi:hypothetical protein